MTENYFDDVELWNELLSLANKFEPDLVPLLVVARAGGMKVKRYQTGAKAGALYVTMSERLGADYSRWSKLHCGPGLKMYKRVQDASRLH